MTLTGPFIDDVAPPASKARWFAWLSLTPTLGVAIGYKLGDLTEYLNWRILFYIEAGVAVPVVLFCLLAPAVRLRGKLAQVHPEGAPCLRCQELAHCRSNHLNVQRAGKPHVVNKLAYPLLHQGWRGCASRAVLPAHASCQVMWQADAGHCRRYSLYATVMTLNTLGPRIPRLPMSCERMILLAHHFYASPRKSTG